MGAESVPAMQRDGVIQNVQYFHVANSDKNLLRDRLNIQKRE